MANVYSYRARDFSGAVIKGQIQADDMNRAAELLRNKRLTILELAPGKTTQKKSALFKKKSIPSRILPSSPANVHHGQGRGDDNVVHFGNCSPG